MSFIDVDANRIEFKEQYYRLDLSFRMVLLYFKAIKDEGLTVPERIEVGLNALTLDDTSQLALPDKAELLKQIFETKINNDRDRVRAKVLKSGKRSFDFDEDESLIKAGFKQQYDIDLDHESLSWEQFTTMLDGLNDDTQFKKVTGFRTVKISDDMDSDTQSYLKQMKLIYGLRQAHTDGDGKLTKEELAIELANLDMPHKAMRLNELRKAGKI